MLNTILKYLPWTRFAFGEKKKGKASFMHWRRKWQPTPVFLPGDSQGQGSLVGCCLWGRTESDTTEATQQQQQQLTLYLHLSLLCIHGNHKLIQTQDSVTSNEGRMHRQKSIFYPCKLSGISRTISSTQRASSIPQREAGVCHPLNQTKTASFSNSQTFYMISHLPIFLSIQQIFFPINSLPSSMQDISSLTRD